MLNILIVDDDARRVELIRETLTATFDTGMVITVCESSDQARQMLLAYYDILILDILLPKKVDGTASALHSLKLLEDVYDPNKSYLRPGLIIGMTADIASLSHHQAEFHRKAIVVLDGSLSNIDWLDLLTDQVRSVMSTKRKIGNSTDRVLITIHGIRTHGGWQESLQQEMKAHSRGFDYVEVKYGFTDLISFAVPFIRAKKAREAARQVRTALAENAGKSVYIVAHSFGTLVLSEALKELDSPGNLKCVVLCGSPLSHHANIDHIVDAAEVTVNECGGRDLILLAARLFLLGLGDAGRVGFRRANTAKFLNRFFKGGHSLYFSSYGADSFYNIFWTPMLTEDAAPLANDERASYPGEDVVDLVIKLGSLAKPVGYAALFWAAIRKAVL